MSVQFKNVLNLLLETFVLAFLSQMITVKALDEKLNAFSIEALQQLCPKKQNKKTMKKSWKAQKRIEQSHEEAVGLSASELMQLSTMNLRTKVLNIH